MTDREEMKTIAEALEQMRDTLDEGRHISTQWRGVINRSSKKLRAIAERMEPLPNRDAIDRAARFMRFLADDPELREGRALFPEDKTALRRHADALDGCEVPEEKTDTPDGCDPHLWFDGIRAPKLQEREVTDQTRLVAIADLMRQVGEKKEALSVRDRSSLLGMQQHLRDIAERMEAEPEPEHQQWEYKYAPLSPAYLAGEGVDDLNKMGEEGWELVPTVFHDGYCRAFLKRPVRRE